MHLSQIKSENKEITLKIRLQAYERLAIYLERMIPYNLVTRLNQGKYTAEEFWHILLHHIREEFEHNFSQQIYLSNEMWELVKSTKEDLIVKITNAKHSLPEKATSIDLAKKILEIYSDKKSNYLIHHTSIVLKAEVRKDLLSS